MPSPTDWWDEVYRTSDVRDLPWYTPALDMDVARALATHLPGGGRVLDLGTGPATQAIALAKRGYEVVATDIAAAAIEKARHAAAKEGVRIDFRVDNILESRLPDGLVDAVVDRGMFHVLPPERRPRYVSTVRRVLRPEGLLLLKTFSDREPRQGGPYHLSRSELQALFEESFDILAMEDTVFQGTLREAPKAWFAVFRSRPLPRVRKQA